MIRRMNYIIRTALAGLLVGLAFSASSLTLTFSGQISQYGFPVPNKTVSYDLNGAPYSSVVSDSLGFFSFNIIDSLLSGNVNVSIVDCQQFQVNQKLHLRFEYHPIQQHPIQLLLRLPTLRTGQHTKSRTSKPRCNPRVLRRRFQKCA